MINLLGKKLKQAIEENKKCSANLMSAVKNFNENCKIKLKANDEIKKEQIQNGFDRKILILGK